MKKPKTNQIKLPNEVQGRDCFSTPRYATELLIPFIPKEVHKIWECAAGDNFITNILDECGYEVYNSDIRGNNFIFNFLTGDINSIIWNGFNAIITNPPYSLKREFFYRCIELNKPFALLVPCDYSSWIIDGLRNFNCQKLVPTRRIDYIPPNKKGSGAQFHSMWFTRYFNLPSVETFVELSLEDKKRI